MDKTRDFCISIHVLRHLFILQYEENIYLRTIT